MEHFAGRTIVAQPPCFMPRACGASQITHALKLPRVSVVRRPEEMIKHGYVERVGNAYRVTNKVNIPELQSKLQQRIEMVAETATRLAELGKRAQ